MDAQLRSPVVQLKTRPQTAASHRQIYAKTQPLISIPGRPQSASTLKPNRVTSVPQSPRPIRPNKGSVLLSSSSTPSRPHSISPVGGVNPTALVKALRKRIHPQVTLNGYSLVKALSKIRLYEASPPRSPKATDWSEQELTYIANAKSLETFLRLMTGKPNIPTKPKKPHVPIWSRPKVIRKREHCPLLDGKD